MSLLSERADAKVLGRSAVGDDGWAVFSVDLGVCTDPGAANGLLEDAEDDVANGFEDPLEEFVENGFAELVVELFENGFPPNNATPRSTAGFVYCASALGSAGFVSFFLFAASDILTPRRTLTLPSLRRHVFLLHVRTYSRLSWPGKCSGRSPFNCRSSTIKSLQTLHFARAAEGGVVGSSHV